MTWYYQDARTIVSTLVIVLRLPLHPSPVLAKARILAKQTRKSGDRSSTQLDVKANVIRVEAL
jgi:hypothetical protein